jgi:hypothetical protein
LMTATEALIAMTAERRSTAADDSVHHLAVLERQMRSVSFPECSDLMDVSS